MKDSKIEWTHHTFNPWIGCTRIHVGCARCYAEADMANRRHRVIWGSHGTRSRTSDAYWRQPLTWNREAEEAGERRRVFCASLADVFEDWPGPIYDAKQRVLWHDNSGGYRNVGNAAVDNPCTMDDLRRDLFALIDKTPWLDWMLLTKRPENVTRMWDVWSERSNYRHNRWIGTSISNQETADKQLPELLKCRALSPVLFVSLEPMLGKTNLTRILIREDGQDLHLNCLTGEWRYAHMQTEFTPGPNGWLIDLVIIGGESGPRARPFNVADAFEVVKQCNRADVAVFFKQMGGNPIVPYYLDDNYLRDWAMDHAKKVRWPDGTEHNEEDFQPPPGSYVEVRLRDKKGGDMEEWPEEFRIRMMPRQKAVAP